MKCKSYIYNLNTVIWLVIKRVINEHRTTLENTSHMDVSGAYRSITLPYGLSIYVED